MGGILDFERLVFYSHETFPGVPSLGEKENALIVLKHGLTSIQLVLGPLPEFCFIICFTRSTQDVRIKAPVEISVWK